MTNITPSSTAVPFAEAGLPGQSIAPVNILLVDDDPRNLDVLESILTAPDYRLVRARSADEALHALVHEDFAVLVLDVRMPDMNGLELAQLIKQRKKTQHVPIIFLTAYYRENDQILRGYGAGGVDYLNKPCNPEVLRSKVAVFVDLFRVNSALQEEIAERKQAELRVEERTVEVQHLVGQLRALAIELTQTEQRERRRLATVLHDCVQQILVSAQMHLAAAQRDTDPESARNTIKSVEGFIKEALDVSRSLTVELSPPILQEVGLGAGLKWLASRMDEKNNFSVDVNVDTTAEPLTQEDRCLLFECTRELLFNALKHAGVTEARVNLVRTDDDRIKLSVEDQGRGFDIDAVRSRINEDSTFGLFSIQERLAHLGGEVHVDAGPGRGTRITLMTPPGMTRDATVSAPSGTNDRSGSRSPVALRRPPAIGVLVVDDHKIMRDCLASLLRTAPDIEVLGEAENGLKAIEMAGRLNPDVIIMDVNMDGMNGIQATRVIMSNQPGIKVIGLSMHTDDDVAHALREAGAVAYLTKGDASEGLIIGTIRASVASVESAPTV
ncbi:MAG: response regulator [Candidatus Hydrogenedentes bacterium]|nr:response regulator [Candidatus Hydrogenedentota bacterium]